MAQIELHPDFKDFLRLLNFNGVEYLIVILRPTNEHVAGIRIWRT